MNLKARNCLIFGIALIVGSLINLILASFSNIIFPLPNGIDATNFDDIKQIIPTLGAKYYIIPFIAHFLGAYFAAKIIYKYTKNKTYALLSSVLFLLGGMINVLMLNIPLKPALFDIIFAYIPAAVVASKDWGESKVSKNENTKDMLDKMIDEIEKEEKEQMILMYGEDFDPDGELPFNLGADTDDDGDFDIDID